MNQPATPSRPISPSLLLSLCGAAAVLLASPAFAQSAPLDGSFDQPLQRKATRVAPAAQGSGTSTTTVHISESDDTGSYSITIKNDEISAKVNGKAVPQDRIRRAGDQVELLDDDGAVLKSFTVAPLGAGQPQVRAWSTAPGGQVTGHTLSLQPDVKVWTTTPSAEPPPRVMIGITMSDSQDGEGIAIDSIIDGLPAQKAGLKVGDIITLIDGDAVTGIDDLRNVMRTKDAGDTLRLTLTRDGEEKEVTVKLSAFDRDKLPNMNAPEPSQMVFKERSSQDSEVWTEACAAIEKALREVRTNENLNPDRLRAHTEKALEQALASLQQAKEQMSIHVRNWREGGQGMRFFSDQPGHAFAIPTPAPSANHPDMNRRLDRLSEQLEKLDKRLDELEQSLSRR